MYLSMPYKISIFKNRLSANCKTLRRGSTLIETLIASIILILALMGYSSSYVSARKQIANQRIYQMAVHLSSQKLEEIRAKEYDNINIGRQEEPLFVDITTYTRITLVELSAEATAKLKQPCKKVTVTTQWLGKVGEQHEVTLVTYIGP